MVKYFFFGARAPGGPGPHY